MDYSNIQSQDKAICHLFLHCCFADGKFTDSEIDRVSGLFVQLGLQHDLDFKKELLDYRTYRESIDDEISYLRYLIQQIQPVNTKALLSYCLELSVSDGKLDVLEEKFFRNLSDVLSINAAEQKVLQELAIERKLVETNKFF